MCCSKKIGRRLAVASGLPCSPARCLSCRYCSPRCSCAASQVVHRGLGGILCRLGSASWKRGILASRERARRRLRRISFLQFLPARLERRRRAARRSATRVRPARREKWPLDFRVTLKSGTSGRSRSMVTWFRRCAAPQRTGRYSCITWRGSSMSGAARSVGGRVSED